MKVTMGSRRWLVVGTAGLLAACCAAHGGAAEPVAAGGGQLRWTPHRAAADDTATGETLVRPEPMPAAAARPAAAPAPLAAPATSGPPVSVTLPPDVPRIDGTVPVSRPPVTRRAAPRSAVAPLRQPAAASPLQGMFDMDMTRTPQGEMPRQMLGAEGPQARAMMQRVAGQMPAERLGGGLAPRYVPASRTAADVRRRSQRVAANTEALPSVMSRAQPEPVIDPVPTPDAAQPETIAAPPASGPALSADDDLLLNAPGYDFGGGDGSEMMMSPEPNDGMWMGEYPSQMHVESFYDDPYECEDEECLHPWCDHHGRICMWLRRFGKPYYGWRWYRDFTASAGVTAFTNTSDLGINGNFGTNEYLNWALPFWNAFGVGWQVGARGVQSNFQRSQIETNVGPLEKNARDQVFVTTGFFTRAFEGRGLQGGAVYDYLHDNWFTNANVSQIRGELSYVWGYHEVGFWGSANVLEQNTVFGPVRQTPGVATTVDMYCGFYRIQFGDANEWKIWGGGTDNRGGIVGSILRAPMSRSLALEGTFTYLIPGSGKRINFDGQGSESKFTESAWNISCNLVYYPAGRSRRSLASPYRPLFEVADNGSLIRTLTKTSP